MIERNEMELAGLEGTVLNRLVWICPVQCIITCQQAAGAEGQSEATEAS